MGYESFFNESFSKPMLASTIVADITSTVCIANIGSNQITYNSKPYQVTVPCWTSHNWWVQVHRSSSIEPTTSANTIEHTLTHAENHHTTSYWDFSCQFSTATGGYIEASEQARSSMELHSRMLVWWKLGRDDSGLGKTYSNTSLAKSMCPTATISIWVMRFWL